MPITYIFTGHNCMILASILLKWTDYIEKVGRIIIRSEKELKR